MEKSVRFFREVFDWCIEFDEGLGFYIIPGTTPADQSLEGGIFTLRHAKLPFVSLYLRVEDIIEKARLVEEKGGRVIEMPHEIPGGSWICLFNNPSGVTFAMIQPKKRSG
jgi:uncharacterized protein